MTEKQTPANKATKPKGEKGEAETAAKGDEPTELAALKAAQEATAAKVDRALETLMIFTRNYPHSMEPEEHDTNRDGMVELGEAADGSVSVTRSPYSDVESESYRSWAANEQFLHEMVEIDIPVSSDPRAEQCFFVSVNGRKRVFELGKRYTVPRYVVETLARARPVHYENQEYIKSSGERAVRNPTRRGLRYPFHVLKDTERGRRWLSVLMAGQ